MPITETENETRLSLAGFVGVRWHCLELSYYIHDEDCRVVCLTVSEFGYPRRLLLVRGTDMHVPEIN